MKRLSFLLFPLGLAAIAILVVTHGAGAIWSAIASMGWAGFGLICLFHLGVFALMGVSWHVIVPEGRGLRGLGVVVWARLIRDSAAEILPFSQVGGFVIGARAATVAGLSGVVAAASTIVDVTLERLA